jgi:hypothetical protein
MGRSIPQPIRLAVIRKWLLGHSRDGLAKDEGIGNETVSAILEQCRKEDADFDLLRAVALELKDRKMRIEDFAPLLRLKNLLEEKEVKLELQERENLFAEYKKFEAAISMLFPIYFEDSFTEKSILRAQVQTTSLFFLWFFPLSRYF